MPSSSPASSSAGTDSVRLANVFVRLPSEQQLQNVKPSAATGQEMALSENTSATQPHRPSASKAPKPSTPQKSVKTFLHSVLPPTPDPTPTKSLKRSSTTAHLEPLTPSIKRHRAAHPTPPLSPHWRLLRASSSTPKFSIAYQPDPTAEEEEGTMSWMELKRIAESVLRQVDWEEVAEDVASNRSARMYKRIVKNVLQEKIEELVARGE